MDRPEDPRSPDAEPRDEPRIRDEEPGPPPPGGPPDFGDEEDSDDEDAEGHAEPEAEAFEPPRHGPPDFDN